MLAGVNPPIFGAPMAAPAGSGGGGTGGSAGREAVVIDTAPPGTPWPTADSDPNVPPALSAPVPTVQGWTGPGGPITREQVNQDAAAWAQFYKNPDGTPDLDAIRQAFVNSYGLPQGQDVDDFLDDVENRVNAIGNDPSGLDPNGDPIPPAAFGDDPNRLQVYTFPAGTIPNIDQPSSWPRNMVGAGW
jgi:hypothetical protein